MVHRLFADSSPSTLKLECLTNRAREPMLNGLEEPSENPSLSACADQTSLPWCHHLMPPSSHSRLLPRKTRFFLAYMDKAQVCCLRIMSPPMFPQLRPSMHACLYLLSWVPE